MQIIKQSTARTLLIGPFLDDTDGKTAETGLTIAQADVRLSKNGGNMAQKNESTSCTHDELGYYTCPVDTTDTATLGILKLMVHESGALPVWQEFLVVTANVWDSLCSTDTLQADITQIGGVAQSATDLKDLADTGYDPSTHKIQSDLIYIHGSALTETAGQLATAFVKLLDVSTPVLTAESVNQSANNNTILAHADYGLAKLVRSTTPANSLDISATGEAGLDFDNIKNASGAHTLTNITVPTVTALTGKTGFSLLSTGANLILKDSTFALAIADAIWDEILTGTTHNIVNSAGRRVREVGAFAIHSGTAQAGTINSITLAATANGGDGIYNRNLIVLTDNTGKGQTRTIIDYNDTTKVIMIDRDWRVTPDNTTGYQIVPDDTPLTVDHGVAQGGTSTTITIRDYASSDDDIYLCNQIGIIAGTGRGQVRLVGGYNGTSKVVTICGDDWITIPDTTSVYVMMPYGTTCTSCTGDYAESQIVAAIIAGIADGSYDLQEMMRLILAACVCKSSGGGTTTIKMRDTGDAKDRILATVDENGNRTAVTLDGS